MATLTVKWLRRGVLMAAVLGLAGACEFYYKNSLITDFHPEKGGFTVTGAFTQDYGLDRDGELKRLGWIQEFADDNDVCPRGYVVTGRKRVYRDIDGEEGVIHYSARCQ